MQRKNYAIGILSLTAVVLAIGNYLLPEAAQAQEVVRERDYSLVTARTNAGADALYVLDHRSGQVAVLMYNNGTQTVEARKVRALTDAFPPPSR